MLMACSRHHKPAPVEERSWHKASQTGAPHRGQKKKKPASRIVVGPSHGKSVPEHVTVRRGDTLYSISFRYHLDWKAVARVNGLKPPYTIYPGQHLKLAAAKKRPLSKNARHAVSRNNKSSARADEKTSGRPDVVVRSKAQPSAVGKPAQATPRGSNKERSKHESPQTKITLKNPGRWHWPVNGRIISSFSPSDPARKGVVIAGHSGDAVRAAADGVVVYTGDALKAYGQLVIIKHSDTYLSAYGYNRRSLVREGQVVKQGQKIAEMGTSPAGKPGLKFEIRKNGRPVDPLQHLPKKR